MDGSSDGILRVSGCCKMKEGKIGLSTTNAFKGA